jgi:hypothetical protein
VNGSFTIQGHEHCIFDIFVEQVEPLDLKIDHEKEERTTVTLTLKDIADGTLLTVVESAFDKVPPERRFEAFRMNIGGWEFQ